MMGKRLAPLIILIALLLSSLVTLAVAGCGKSSKTRETGNAEVTPGGGAVESSKAAACAATRKLIESALQSYRFAQGEYPSSLLQLVPQFLQKIPTCPSGGTYDFSGGSVTCSVHGS